MKRKIFNRELIWDELLKKYKKTSHICYKSEFDECLNLLEEREEIQQQIENLEQEKQQLNYKTESTMLYLFNGGVYCRILEIINDLYHSKN